MEQYLYVWDKQRGGFGIYEDPKKGQRPFSNQIGFAYCTPPGVLVDKAKEDFLSEWGFIYA